LARDLGTEVPNGFQGGALEEHGAKPQKPQNVKIEAQKRRFLIEKLSM